MSVSFGRTRVQKWIGSAGWLLISVFRHWIAVAWMWRAGRLQHLSLWTKINPAWQNCSAFINITQLSIYTFTNGFFFFGPPTRHIGASSLSSGQARLIEGWKPQALPQPRLPLLTTNPCVWYIRRPPWLCSAAMCCPDSCQVFLLPYALPSCSCCSPEDYGGVHGIYLIVFN